MAIILILAPLGLPIPSVMSSSDSIIEGALISVDGKNKTFLPIFTSFFYYYYSYNQILMNYYDHFTSYCAPYKTSDSLKFYIYICKNVNLLYSPSSCSIELVEKCSL